MDTEYLIRIVLRARDEMAGAFAAARSQMNAFARDAKQVDRDLDGLNNRLSGLNTRLTNTVNRIRAIRGELQDWSGSSKSAGDAVEDLGDRVGTATRSVEEHRRTVRDTERDHHGLIGAVERFGLAATRAGTNVASLGQEMRGLMIVGVLVFAQQLITVLATLGGSLLSVASSAALAGAALGGTLAAGLAQAAPAVGLLIAAFQRVGSVMDALKQRQNALQQSSTQQAAAAGRQRNAADQVRNAQEGLRRAQERLQDSNRRVTEAQERLNRARRQGRREIEDLMMAERRATLGQQEAQRSLEGAVAEGRTGDLAGAELDAEEARMERRRAAQDARAARRGGVEGLDSVRGAREALADARRAVTESQRAITIARRGLAEARRDVADVSKQSVSAARNLNYLLAQLSPAERRLYAALVRIQDNFRRTFRPITDIIVNSFVRVVNRVNKVMGDIRVTGPLTALARSMGSAFDRITRSFTGNRALNVFAKLVGEMTRNMKPLTDAAIDLGHAFLNIAEAASPALRLVVDWFADFSRNIRKGTEDRDKLEGFFVNAAQHLRAWAELGGGVIELLAALAGAGASEEGLTSVQKMTNALNRWSDWIDKNEKKVHNFFKESRESVEALWSVVAEAGKAFARIMGNDGSKNVEAFANILKRVFIPALEQTIKAIGVVVRGVETLLDNKAVAFFAKWTLTLVLFGKVATSTVGIIGRMAGNLAQLARFTAAPIKFAADFAKGLAGRTVMKGTEEAAGEVGTTFANRVGNGIRNGARRVRDIVKNLFTSRAADNAVSSAGGEAAGGFMSSLRGRLSRAARSVRDLLSRMLRGRAVDNVVGEAGGEAGGAFASSLRTRISGWARRVRETLRNIFTSRAAQSTLEGAGAAAGSEAAGGMAGSIEKQGTTKGSRMRRAFNKLGLALGPLLAAAILVGLAPEIEKGIEKIMRDVGRWAGGKEGEQAMEKFKSLAEKIPGPFNQLKRMSDLAEKFGLQTGGFIPARPGGVPALIGEGGYDEVVLTTDPSHRRRTMGLMREFLARMGGAAFQEGGGVEGRRRAGRGRRGGNDSEDAVMTTIEAINEIWDRMWDRLTSRSKKGNERVVDYFREMERDIRTLMRRAASRTEDSFERMLRSGRRNTNRLSDVTKDNMREVMRATYTGMDYVGDATNEALKGVDGKRVDFKVPRPRGLGKADGGFVGNQGERGRDAVDLRVGRGEAIVNGPQQQYLSPAVQAYYGHSFADTFKRVRGYHAGGYESLGFARGGMVPLGNTGKMIDRRLERVVLQMMRKWRFAITAAGEGGHSRNSDHHWGGALDLVPGRGGSWNLLDRLAKASGWRPNRPMPGRGPFRWIGWNTEPSHGQPPRPNAHLHLSWNRGGPFVGPSGEAGAVDVPKIKVQGKPQDSPLRTLAQKAIDRVRDAANKLIEKRLAAMAETSGGGSLALGPGGAAQKVFDYMVKRGFSEAQAAGWVGVFKKESDFSTTVRNPTSGATGLAQWLGGRLTALKRKRNWQSLQTQLDFVWQELMGPESAAYRAIKTARTPEGAARLIDSKYERSDAILGATGYARDAYQRFAGSPDHGRRRRATGGPASYDIGGEIPGAEGQPRPILAHGKEWIVNPRQQNKLAALAGLSRDRLRNLLGFSGTQDSAQGGVEIAAARRQPLTLRQRLSRYGIRIPDIVKWVDNLLLETSHAVGVVMRDIDKQLKAMLKLKRTDPQRGRRWAQVIAGLTEFTREGGVLDQFNNAFTQFQTSLTNRLRRATFRIRGGRVTRALTEGQVLDRELENTRAILAPMQRERDRIGAVAGDADVARRRVDTAIREIERGGVTAAEKKRHDNLLKERRMIMASINNLRERSLELDTQIGDTMQAIWDQQIAQQQRMVDEINQRYEDSNNWISALERVWTARGNLRLFGAGVIDARINNARGQIDELQRSLAAAEGLGNTELARTLRAQILDLQVSIEELAAQKFQFAIDQVNRAATTSLARLDTMQQIVELTHQMAGTVATGELLGLADQRRTALTVQRAGLEKLLAEAVHAGNLDKIDELNQALLENQLALLQNTQQLNELNNLTKAPQTFTTTAWQMYRQAIFNGMGGLLPQFASAMPFMQDGGRVVTDGMAYLHAGEIVVNPKKGQSLKEEHNWYVTSPTEVADPDYFSDVFSFRRGTARATQ